MSDFFERVMPHPLSLIWTLILPVSFYLVLLPINEFAGIFIGIFAFLAVLLSLWFAAPVIEISDGQLSVGNASIALKLISKVEVIAPEAAFAERGPKLSPAAYVRFQPTVSGLVKVFLSDPEDPTPYWLFSSRKGNELKDLLKR